MYIRFVTYDVCEESRQKLGILHAIRYLRDDGKSTKEESSLANEIFRWFDKNLESPLDYLNKQKLKKI